jgi:pSer/pThr/pTyr-binding forkhead associated (FHA) protein
MVQKVIKEAWLTDAQGRQLIIKPHGATRLGRSFENDVVLEDSTVSQRHAVISFDAGHSFLRDLGSRNGTFIAGGQGLWRPVVRWN